MNYITVYTYLFIRICFKKQCLAHVTAQISPVRASYFCEVLSAKISKFVNSISQELIKVSRIYGELVNSF